MTTRISFVIKRPKPLSPETPPDKKPKAFAASSCAGTALQVYLKEINRVELLSAKEEAELAWKVLKGDDRARERMVRANLRFVVSVAKNYVNRGLPLLDLIEEGNIGLLHAVDGFDPSEGWRFSTYAAWWIKQSIQRALINSGKTIRLPVYLMEKLSRWKAKSRELSIRLKRQPSPEEVAKEVDISAERMELIKRAIKPAGSLDNSVSNGDFVWFVSEQMPDLRTKPPEEKVFESHEKERVSKLLARIDERKATVLRMHFGLGGCRPMTLKQVGEKLNLSGERVRQIEKEALRKLYDLMPREAN